MPERGAITDSAPPWFSVSIVRIEPPLGGARAPVTGHQHARCYERPDGAGDMFLAPAQHCCQLDLGHMSEGVKAQAGVEIEEDSQINTVEFQVHCDRRAYSCANHFKRFNSLLHRHVDKSPIAQMRAYSIG